MKHICYSAAVLVLIFFAGIGMAQESGQKQISPKKVEVDSNYDGKIDRIEVYDASGQIARVESDTNGDGVMDDWITYKDGKPVKSERDTNKDGKPDVWVEY